MESKQHTLFSQLQNLVLPIFIPGHLAARFTMGCCLGLTIVGIMNLIFLFIINNSFGPHVNIEFGLIRIGALIAAICYIVYSVLMNRGLVKTFRVEKSVNTGESSAKVSVRRAA